MQNKTDQPNQYTNQRIRFNARPTQKNIHRRNEPNRVYRFYRTPRQKPNILHLHVPKINHNTSTYPTTRSKKPYSTASTNKQLLQTTNKRRKQQNKNKPNTTQKKPARHKKEIENNGLVIMEASKFTQPNKN